MSEKAQNVQDVFLNHVRKNKTPVTIFLVNGVKLQGIVTWFDNFSVLLRRDAHSQLVYKHAISTIMPVSRSSCSTGTKPKADLTQDIQRNGHDKRQRTPYETARPATVAAVLSPYSPGLAGPGSTRQRCQARGSGRAGARDRPRRAACPDGAAAPARRPRPCSARAWSSVPRRSVEEQGIGLVIVDDRLTPGAAAQSRDGVERQGDRPHRPDPRDLRRARPHA